MLAKLIAAIPNVIITILASLAKEKLTQSVTEKVAEHALNKLTPLSTNELNAEVTETIVEMFKDKLK